MVKSTKGLGEKKNHLYFQVRLIVKVPSHLSQTAPKWKDKNPPVRTTSILEQKVLLQPAICVSKRYLAFWDHFYGNEFFNHALLFPCSEGLLLESPLSRCRERNKQVSGNHILFLVAK